MRNAARIDANQREIVAAIRAVGAHVIDTSRVGDGFPDLLVGYRGRWMLVEVKDGRKPPSRRVKTSAQVKWWDTYAHVGPVALVTDVESALRVVGMM